jgi:pyruvate dehydrogenase E1 component alpha subunit
MLQRGVKMSDILAYWGGDERGSDFANPHDLPICVPIASQCLHAAGVAVAFKLRKQPRVAVAVVGDGGTSKGDFYEAINLAGVWQLPIVFVINNNQWAISLPRSAQTGAETLAQKAIAAGIQGEQVDGNDVIAMREACARALEKARLGGGPTLIEALSYRLCDHTTADDASRYRQVDEVIAAQAKEPLTRLRTYLINQGVWDQAAEKALIADATEEVEAAVEIFKNATPQPPTAMVDYLYASLPHALADQRNDILENV